jgi:hypothetical protein
MGTNQRHDADDTGRRKSEEADRGAEDMCTSGADGGDGVMGLARPRCRRQWRRRWFCAEGPRLPLRLVSRSAP